MGSKTTVEADKPTAEETALTVKQTELAEFQLIELKKQSAFQEAQAEQFEPLLKQFEELAPLQFELAKSDLERAKAFGPISDELLQLELEAIRRGGAASPQQLELIQEATEQGIALGESDISRFQGTATERIAQELAPALGLRPTDTPIIDRGGRIAEEAVRQQGQLVRGPRGAEATAKLNFPLAAQQLQSAQTQFQQGLAQSTAQFQANLRTSAFLNRLRLSQGTQQLGLGLATGFSPDIGAFPRGGGSTTRSSPGLGGIGSALGGIGGLLSGLGSVGAFGGGSAASAAASSLFFPIISSRELKRDPEGIGLSTKPVELQEGSDGVYRPARQIDHEETLAKVEKLPVERWRYKEGLGLAGGDHIGSYADSFRDSFGVGDGETINIVDAVGIGLSATKGLAARVRRIEHGIGLAGA